MKRILVLIFLLINVAVFAQTPSQKLAAALNPKYQKVLVAAHRGDWRNAPENSIQALKNCITKGFDIMELDVKMTKDSQMVVMHDNTIDRTTNGKGKVGDFSFSELQKFGLKNGLGRITDHKIPLLKDMMVLAKGQIIINVDKGNDHLPEVFKVLQETKTVDQAIVNIGDNVDQVKFKSFGLPKNAYFMVVVNMKEANALQLISGYDRDQNVIIQPIFNTDTLANIKSLPAIANKQTIWLNGLWPSLNGGHDDDTAVEKGNKEESWGWLLRLKPRIVQTDRPSELKQYLRN